RETDQEEETKPARDEAHETHLPSESNAPKPDAVQSFHEDDSDPKEPIPDGPRDHSASKLTGVESPDHDNQREPAKQGKDIDTGPEVFNSSSKRPQGTVSRSGEENDRIESGFTPGDRSEVKGTGPEEQKEDLGAGSG